MRLSTLLRFYGARKRRDLEWFPPYWLMGIKMLDTGDNWRRVRICLPLRLCTRNMGGTMFGGSQASLADPIPAIACAHLFPDWAVWTKDLRLRFLKTGNSDLELRFDFDPATEAGIARDLAEKGRSDPHFEFGFYRQDGQLCTQVYNTVAIRPKGYKSQAGAYQP